MVIFCCGVVTGTLVSGNAPWRHGPPRNPAPHPFGGGLAAAAQRRNTNLLSRLDKELALTPSQHERIENIICASQERTQVLFDAINPAMEKEVARMRSEIHDELTPDQQKKFDTILKAHRRPDGPPGRDGDPFHHGTNHFHSNGPPPFFAPPAAPQSGGPSTNAI